MTKDELIQRGYAALVLIEDPTVSAYLKNVEKMAIEDAIANPFEAENHLIKVEVIRGISRQLEVAAQEARKDRNTRKS